MYLDRDHSISCIVVLQKSVHSPVSQLHTKSVSHYKYRHLAKNDSLKSYSSQTDKLNDNQPYYGKISILYLLLIRGSSYPPHTRNHL